ncbi:hypothetical protein PG989_001245 [Apiospora arundinis]
MTAPRLRKAFQAEFDSLLIAEQWPLEYKDPISDLREPREKGAQEAREALLQAQDRQSIHIEDYSFQRSAPRAGTIELTVVSPSEGGNLARPCVVFCHGGAMAGSDRYVGLHVNGPLWVKELGAITVSVEYERAPENHNDGLARDCYEALCWIWRVLEFDHTRLLMYGASAGGTLAAGAAFMLAQDRQVQDRQVHSELPELCGLLLEAPMLDPNCDTASMRRLSGNGPFLNREACRFIWQQVIRGPGPVTHLIAPAKADVHDLAGLPPTAAYVGDMDPLHDEVLKFMEAAERKDFICKNVEGVPHGFDAMLPEEAISQEVKAWVLKWISVRWRLYG